MLRTSSLPPTSLTLPSDDEGEEDEEGGGGDADDAEDYESCAHVQQTSLIYYYCCCDYNSSNSTSVRTHELYLPEPQQQHRDAPEQRFFSSRECLGVTPHHHHDHHLITSTNQLATVIRCLFVLFLYTMQSIHLTSHLNH